ncbi:hypothetical protein WG906_19340, partial [Pedobacter sp. P351]|uniref:hypothetical protein n=1 Tax=Pedobacter superstes TaxID=3133441 RepID=UPI00309B5C0A
NAPSNLTNHLATFLRSRAVPKAPVRFRQQQASSSGEGIGLFPEALAFQRRRKQGAALSGDGEMCCSLVAKGTFGTALIFGPFHQGKGLGHAAAMSGKDKSSFIPQQ